MGIKVEFNPDLALRDISEYTKGRRKREECVPAALKKGQTYNFLKQGQRLYWLHRKLPLLKTKGNEKLSSPLASVVITEATHTLVGKEIWTKGKYKIVEVFVLSRR